MPESLLLLIGVIFAIGGLSKGIIGLGLPTITMGLLAIVMTPLQAAAILLLPSLVTNLWQMAVGPGLGRIARRLWVMMIGVCLGTWAGMGFMSGGTARFGAMLLGVALVLYAIIGLSKFTLRVPGGESHVTGGLVGLLTGLVTAATGVFVIPAVPYLQAIGFEKDELVQALGLSFCVSTLALGLNVARAGALGGIEIVASLVALAAACAGMWLGQRLRATLDPVRFRRWFFTGLLMLGTYLAAKPLF